MTVMKKYAVIWCSDASGDDLVLQEKIISAFGRENEEWEIIHPVENDFLEKAFDYSGHVISGSPKSVIDDAQTPLVSNLLAFLRGAAQRGEGPVVGLCFGAQAIAAALGGQVGRNPSGRFKLGVDRLEWSNEAQVLFGPQVGAGPTVLVQSHGECVTTLPPGGVQLASSQTIPHEVFLVNGQFLGIQGHPEVDRQFLQQGFMVYLRALFDDDEWVRVQQESQQALDPERVIALGRRLLDAGRLPATPQDISALPA